MEKYTLNQLVLVKDMFENYNFDIIKKIVTLETSIQYYNKELTQLNIISGNVSTISKILKNQEKNEIKIIKDKYIKILKTLKELQHNCYK